MRAVGTLRYLDTGIELVDAHPSSLGDPRALVGLRVEGGAHGGPEVGRVVSARREGGSLVATMRLDAHARARIASGEWSEFSSEYDRNLRADGVQIVTAFRAVALVPMGRCGSACSVRSDSGDEAPDVRARRRMIERSRVYREDTYRAPRVVETRHGAHLEHA